jgi:hypothetical protein
MNVVETVVWILVVGAGATAVLDSWLMLLKRMGIQTLNFAMIGRWAGHLARGTFVHPAIGKAQPIPGELAIGWLIHYAVGVAFAGLLASLLGTAWMQAPSLLPALAVGMGTVAMPLFVMQPAMGLGFAASRTPAPLQNCIRSLVNHTVFGLGLYLNAVAIASISR